jgi:hypothetical protein
LLGRRRRRSVYFAKEKAFVTGEEISHSSMYVFGFILMGGI